MAKRHRVDMDSPSKIAKPGDEDDTVESTTTTEFAKPVYLVAAQEQSYSVFMVDAAAVTGGNDDDPPSARVLAGGLPGFEPGMSFVAAHSEHGSWIVGVGGPRGRTTIYDPRSSPAAAGALRGPEHSYPKHEPILISHGGKVYALSRRPMVHRRSKLDFPPWFESLSFKKGVACIYLDHCPSWKSLPPPPCFPCLLDPREFRCPPDISVSSYAAVGSHILISLLEQEEEETGTYGFHVVGKKWEKQVCDKNLPFVGQAVPIGGGLFAACRRFMPANNAGPVVTISVFHVSMEVSTTPAVKVKLTTSPIQEFPVPSSDGEIIPRPLLCPLGRGSFCAIRLGCLKDDPHIILTALQMDDDVESIQTACQTKNAEVKDLHGAVLQVKQENRIYKFEGGSRFLASVHMPVIIAALSMDMTY